MPRKCDSCASGGGCGSKIEDPIVTEAMHWVRKNNGLTCDTGDTYPSPRISSEINDCSMPLTFDQYNYCSLGCLYCFAYFFKTNNPSIKSVELKAVDAQAMLSAMEGKAKNKRDSLMWEHFYSKKFLLHWGGLADPFCSFEKSNGVGLDLINGLARLNYPTLFSFKGATIFQPEYRKVFEDAAKQRNFAFQVSIITADDKLAQQIEIGVPSPTRRLAALAELSSLGYWTILRLRPFVIGVSEKSLDMLLEKALAAGIKGVSMEFFAMDNRSNVGMKTRYDWIAQLIGVKNLQKYFRDLSPSERGGYMRLNRMVKEPYVRKVYTFCKENGLVCGISDPDFKELNTSGSCCAMPDNYAPNKGLENWSRSQLTFHLKEARRLFHTTGKPQYLKFDTVYPRGISYMESSFVQNDHVSVIGMPCAERMQSTFYTLIRKQWNNLNSPACPYNYLHGKVRPVLLDSDGNYVFQYVEHDYEKRWKSEGVDLCR